MVTDQTSAHDALGGYVPAEISLADAAALRDAQPDEYVKRSVRAMADHVRAMLAFQDAGAVVFDYGNNLRAQAMDGGVENASLQTQPAIQTPIQAATPLADEEPKEQ